MVLTVRLIFGISCRMLSTNQMSFRYALICLVSCSLGLWSQTSWAGETSDCGDWACSIHGAAFTFSENNHRYTVLKGGEDYKCDYFSHHISRVDVSELRRKIKANKVKFRFEDGSKVSVTVVGYSNDKILLEPMNETPKLEHYLRDKNSFEIRSGGELISGPYGLWGSNRAIGNIEVMNVNCN